VVLLESLEALVVQLGCGSILPVASIPNLIRLLLILLDDVSILANELVLTRKRKFVACFILLSAVDLHFDFVDVVGDIMGFDTVV
jgi:hypothetical protein